MRNIIGLILIFSTAFAFFFTISCNLGVGSDDDDDPDDDAIDDDTDDDVDDDGDDDVNDDTDDDADDDADDDLNDDADDDTDDDDDIPWDERCESMINEYYDQCNNALFDLTRDQAIASCINLQPPEIPWECVIECWDEAPVCAAWFACIMDNCDLPQPDDDADDDVDDDVDDDIDDDIFLDFESMHLFNPDMLDGEEFVIRTQNEWDAFVGNLIGHKLWYELNFEEFMVVGINTGAGGCAVWGRITGIYMDQDSIDVSYAHESGGPCYCYVNLPMFAVIAKSELPVNFYPVDMAAERNEALYSDLFLNTCLFDQENEFVIRTQDDWNLFIGYEPGDDRYEFTSMLNFDVDMVLGILADASGCVGIGQVFDIGPDWIGNYLWFTYFAQGEGPCDSVTRVPIFATYPQSDLGVDFLAVE